MKSKEFLGDAKLVLKGLEDAAASLAAKRQRANDELKKLTLARALKVRADVERLLPDLSMGTFDKLYKELPDFARRSFVASAFAKAKYLSIPFFTRLFGDPERYRRQAMVSDLEKLRAQLAADLPTGSFQGVDPRIKELTDRVHDFDVQVDSILRQIQMLKQTHKAVQGGMPVPPRLAKAVSKSANALPDVRTKLEQDGEDYSDIVIYWATGMPTSLRTAAYDMLAGHEHDSITPTPELVPGGGTFGGAGSSGTWDKSADAAAPASRESDAASTASLAALGSYS